jgi:hypothetical protein
MNKQCSGSNSIVNVSPGGVFWCPKCSAVFRRAKYKGGAVVVPNHTQQEKIRKLIRG